MILGMDLTDQSNLDAVWPFISNREVIAVNQVISIRVGVPVVCVRDCVRVCLCVRVCACVCAHVSVCVWDTLRVSLTLTLSLSRAHTHCRCGRGTRVGSVGQAFSRSMTHLLH